jgi:hypothetical protein
MTYIHTYSIHTYERQAQPLRAACACGVGVHSSIKICKFHGTDEVAAASLLRSPQMLLQAGNDPVCNTAASGHCLLAMQSLSRVSTAEVVLWHQSEAAARLAGQYQAWGCCGAALQSLPFADRCVVKEFPEAVRRLAARHTTVLARTRRQAGADNNWPCVASCCIAEPRLGTARGLIVRSDGEARCRSSHGRYLPVSSDTPGIGIERGVADRSVQSDLWWWSSYPHPGTWGVVRAQQLTPTSVVSTWRVSDLWSLRADSHYTKLDTSSPPPPLPRIAASRSCMLCSLWASAAAERPTPLPAPDPRSQPPGPA